MINTTSDLKYAFASGSVRVDIPYSGETHQVYTDLMDYVEGFLDQLGISFRTKTIGSGDEPDVMYLLGNRMGSICVEKRIPTMALRGTLGESRKMKENNAVDLTDKIARAWSKTGVEDTSVSH
ncbi:hypothetical protein JXC34_00960 [Candidatus Woesearchaeota archaeon]|nr:hypothetical protein [Candidatus Woesearchaeota archaeon]